MGRRSRGGACIELGKKVKLETRAIAVKQIQEIIKYLNLVILNDFLSNSSFSLRCRHYLTPPVLDPTIGGGGGGRPNHSFLEDVAGRIIEGLHGLL